MLCAEPWGWAGHQQARPKHNVYQLTTGVRKCNEGVAENGVAIGDIQWLGGVLGRGRPKGTGVDTDWKSGILGKGRERDHQGQ